jgi:phosphofructokinase-like protein
MRLAVLTGGGDCPGLNSVIRAVVKTSILNGFEVLGVREGWKGMIDNVMEPLEETDIGQIIDKGGTMLKSSRTNPLKVDKGIEKIKDNIKKEKIDALIAIGGDDTLSAAYELLKKGVKIVGVPKTIDKDISFTDYTIGFDTATNVVMECIDRLRTTAESHSRCMVVEVMGRHSGWVAVTGGIAGGADYIVIPERKFTVQEIIDALNRKKEKGQTSFIVVVAEGATLGDDFFVTQSDEKDQFGHEQLGGIGKLLTEEIKEKADIDTRYVSIGHIERGGSPTAYDRVLGTRLGVKAVDLVKEGSFGQMLAIKSGDIVHVDLLEGIGKTNVVSDEWYSVARVFF